MYSAIFSLLKNVNPMALYGFICALGIALIGALYLYEGALEKNAYLEVELGLKENAIATLKGAIDSQNAQIKALQVNTARVESLNLQTEKRYANILIEKDASCAKKLEKITQIVDLFYKE